MCLYDFLRFLSIISKNAVHRKTHRTYFCFIFVAVSSFDIKSLYILNPYRQGSRCSAFSRKAKAVLRELCFGLQTDCRYTIKKEQSELCSGMVPLVGVEPTRSCPRRILSPLRLPISPQRHSQTTNTSIS